jgi:molecular chaperone DnaJ
VLEVESTIGVKELKKSYYKVVFKYHPDNKETAEEKDLCNKQMMVINGAYRVLKDPATRQQYDKQIAKGVN